MAPGRSDNMARGGVLKGALIFILTDGWSTAEVLETLSYIRVSLARLPRPALSMGQPCLFFKPACHQAIHPAPNQLHPSFI